MKWSLDVLKIPSQILNTCTIMDQITANFYNNITLNLRVSRIPLKHCILLHLSFL